MPAPCANVAPATWDVVHIVLERYYVRRHTLPVGFYSRLADVYALGRVPCGLIYPRAAGALARPRYGQVARFVSDRRGHAILAYECVLRPGLPS